jgi:flagellar biosynthetic protein FliR
VLTFGTLALAPFLAAFGRVGGFLVAAPFVGDRTTPLRVRAAAATVIAFALAPLRAPLGVQDLVFALPAEIALGLAAGFAARVVIAGVEAGGQIIGQQLGLGFAGAFDPMIGDQEMPTARLARVAFGLTFVGTGGIEACVAALAAPPATVDTLTHAVGAVLAQGGDVLVAGIRLAAPAIVAAFVANLAAALASRASPALNVFSVVLALLLVIGGIVLLATAPLFVAELVGNSSRLTDAVGRVLGQGR